MTLPGGRPANPRYFDKPPGYAKAESRASLKKLPALHFKVWNPCAGKYGAYEFITIDPPGVLPYWLRPAKKPTLTQTITRLRKQVVRDERTGETWKDAVAYVKDWRTQHGLSTSLTWEDLTP